MPEEWDTSSIVTRLEFTPDFTGLNTATNKLQEWAKNVTSSFNYKPTAIDVKDITENFTNLEDRLDITKAMDNSWKALRRFDESFSSTITNVKNLEDQLDTMRGAFGGSTEALVTADSEFNNLYGSMTNFAEAGTRTVVTMQRLGQTTLITTTTFNQFGEVIRKNTREVTQNWKRFEMWALSVMFFGMQIKRIFGGMWTSMNTAYTKITENTTALGQANLRLSASMTFLQVSIMTALEPILIPLVETIIDLVNWFNELPEPIKQVAGLFIVGGYFTGGIMQALGSITMFVNFGLIPLLTKLGLIAGPTGAAATAGSAISSAFAPFVGGIAIVLSFIWAAGLGPDDVFGAIGSTVLAAAGGFLIAGPPGALAAAVINVAIIIAWSDFGKDIRDQLGKARDDIVKWADEIRIEIQKDIQSIPIIGPILVPQIEGLKESSSETRQTLEDLKNDTSLTMTTIEEVMKKPGEGWMSTQDAIRQSQDPLQQFFDLVGGWWTQKVKNLTSSIYGTSPGLIPGLKETARLAKDVVPPAINIMISSVNSSSAAFNDATASVNAYVVALSRIPAAPLGMTNITTTSKVLGYKQMGGPINQEGLYYLHQGEYVTPKGGGTNINVGDINIDISSGPISNDIDVKDLANKVSDEIMKDIRNYTKYVPQW